MIATLMDNLKLAGSKLMNVDGSSVAKVFSYSPGSGVVTITTLTFIMDDPGVSSLSKFGSQTALTNGLLFSVTISGVTTNLTTVKDNADLVTRFPKNHFGNSASDTLGGSVGFGDTYDAFVGTLELVHPIVLTGADSIQVTVRDNLSTISTLQMACVIAKDV